MKEKMSDTIHMKIEPSIKRAFSEIAVFEGFDGYASYLRKMMKDEIKKYRTNNPVITARGETNEN